MTLFRAEVALAKAELREATLEARLGISSLIGGLALAGAGLLTLVLGLVLLLATQIAAWLAALMVGIVVLAIGVAMINAAQAKIKPGVFAPGEPVKDGLDTGGKTA